jgi:hypothetical protein
MKSYSWLQRTLLIGSMVVAICSLRLIHLEADMPLEMVQNVESGRLSVGLYVDEGYKTLDARNLFLYGTPKWNPHDQFHGWMHRSPLTQWAFYLSFSILGPGLASARLVAIVSFLVLLLGYTLGTCRKYSLGLFLSGLILLGLSHHIFLFSRIAIFVLPIAACLYCVLFFLGREGLAERPLPVIVAVVVVSSLATFGIKQSAPLYFFPLLLAVALVIVMSRRRSRSTTVAIVLGMGLTGAVILLGTQPIWWSRMRNISPQAVFSSILDNGLSPSAGVLVCLGLICAFHALLTRSRAILGKPYGAGLVAIVVLGPILVSIFPYHPLRYYVPLLPAFLLLVLEWLHVRAWKSPIPDRSAWYSTGICLLILTAALLNMARAVNHQILSNLPLPLGPEPGLSAAAMYRYVVPMAAVLAAGLWIGRRTIFAGRAILALVIALLAVSTARDILVDGRFLLYPSYRSRAITAELRSLVPGGAAVGGDWAPFLTLDSEIRALYMNGRFNRGAHITALRPDYFLYSETQGGRVVKEDLEMLEGVMVGPALLRASYAERDVILYPLTYGE